MRRLHTFWRIIASLFFLCGYAYAQSLPFELKAQSPASTNDPGWLAFGDIRGYFEPCGCDPATDLGGMKRLEAYLTRERRLHPGILIFSLGNSYDLDVSPVSARKNAATAEALAVLEPTASLVNRAELLITEFKQPSIAYVLSNISEANKASNLKIMKKLEAGNTIIYGFVEPFSEFRGLSAFDRKFWEDERKLALTSGKTSVLLYGGSSKQLNEILRTKLFDVVVSSHDWPLSKKFGDEDRKDEKRLIAAKFLERDVLKTPLGGQGVIRSETLQAVPPAEPLAQLLSVGMSPSATKAEKPGLLLKRYLVKWLGKDEETGVSKAMDDVVQNFRKASSDSMTAMIAERSKDLQMSPYAGSESCQSCHVDSYKIWKASKHAAAFSTIKKAGRTSDPECVSCHVLGFKSFGGFVSEDLSPQFTNVQCENCHGPRKDHVANPTIKSKVDAKGACAECHTPPHSPKFDHKIYWDRIKHK